MFFKKRPKPPLARAISLVHEAVEIAYQYKRDKRYQPTDDDLRMFEGLYEALSHNMATAGYISRCMDQRARGEPEGAKKFTDPEVFDYHYPP